MNLFSDLNHIVTQYDIRQSKKKYYNINALHIYLKRVEEVADEAKSIGWRKAVDAGFNDRLHTFVVDRLEKLGYR